MGKITPHAAAWEHCQSRCLQPRAPWEGESCLSPPGTRGTAVPASLPGPLLLPRSTQGRGTLEPEPVSLSQGSSTQHQCRAGHRAAEGSAQQQSPPAALCQVLGPPAALSFSSIPAALALRSGVCHPTPVPLRHVPGRVCCLQPGGPSGAGQAFLQDIGGDPERLQGVHGYLPAHCIRG